MSPSLELARASYRDIALYSVESAPCDVDLSDNTNLWGAPPATTRALRDLADSGFTRYPSAYANELKEAIAAYAGVDTSSIVTGCGSDDILDSAIRAFAESGDRLACCTPTFAMIPIFARLNGVEIVSLPMTPTWDIDADALAKTDARIIYVCSPNNPTGTAASRASLERLITNASGVIILDEAYAEFADDARLDLAMMSDRVLIVRTMSKAFGLAGLRVGYAVGARSLVAEVEKSRGPYKVSIVGERAAVAALTQDRDWVAEHVSDARIARTRLAEALRTLGLTPLPSQANFLLVPVPHAIAVARRLRELGVAVRAFEALPAVGDALRITAGPPPMMDRLIAALEDALACA
ncbi:MAG: histidinol-phosphate aminotransferase family protein [Gemmatimonadota bacterium]|nr:histidinol-phosphate aminotransferase family protein [Gemmatimonadota bacterium]